MAEIGDAFVQGTAHWTADSLATRLRAPAQVTSEVISDLARADLLLLAGSGELPQVAPAADLDRVHVTDILQACRHRTHEPAQPSQLEQELISPVGGIADDLEADAEKSDRNLSLRELAHLARERREQAGDQHP